MSPVTSECGGMMPDVGTCDSERPRRRYHAGRHVRTMVINMILFANNF